MYDGILFVVLRMTKFVSVAVSTGSTHSLYSAVTITTSNSTCWIDRRRAISGSARNWGRKCEHQVTPFLQNH